MGYLLTLLSGLKYVCVTERKETNSQMNSEQNKLSLQSLCESGEIYNTLSEYLLLCRGSGEEQPQDTSLRNSSSKKAQKISFPNLAGFCRYLGISTDDFATLSVQCPSDHGKILTVLEDEALNSSISASLLSAYLKVRLGYDKTSSTGTAPSQLSITFEHDIFEDGE